MIKIELERVFTFELIRIYEPHMHEIHMHLQFANLL